MGGPFSDIWAEEYCCSMNALFVIISWDGRCTCFIFHIICIINTMASDLLVTMRNQVISSSGIDLVLLEYSGLSTWKVWNVHNLLVTHWGWVTHICVDNQTIIGSDNGLLPDRRQAIIWTNAGILLIGPLGTNFNEILIKIYTVIEENAFENVAWKMVVILSRPQCVN